MMMMMMMIIIVMMMMMMMMNDNDDDDDDDDDDHNVSYNTEIWQKVFVRVRRASPSHVIKPFIVGRD